MVGPLARILDNTKEVNCKEVQVDFLHGWSQQGICLVGAANVAFIFESCKAITMRISPDLGKLAKRKLVEHSTGLLFGDSMVKTTGNMSPRPLLWKRLKVT